MFFFLENKKFSLKGKISTFLKKYEKEGKNAKMNVFLFYYKFF
jgi:hypothetical protein